MNPIVQVFLYYMYWNQDMTYLLVLELLLWHLFDSGTY